jgi:hypothetical protein
MLGDDSDVLHPLHRTTDLHKLHDRLTAALCITLTSKTESCYN